MVVNADFARGMQRLVPEELRPSWDDDRIERSEFSCSTFMLYLGIEGRYDDLAHHTIYTSAEYEQNLADIEKNKVLSDDPPFYVQNASVTDPSLAPEGHSTLYVLVPVPNQTPNVDWAKEQARYRDLMIRQLAKVGIHDVEERIRYE